MAAVPPAPAHGDPSRDLPRRPPPPSRDGANDPRWQPPLDDQYPAEGQRTAAGPCTATDGGAGVTSDSPQAWQSRRGEFGTFVRAQPGLDRRHSLHLSRGTTG